MSLTNHLTSRANQGVRSLLASNLSVSEKYQCLVGVQACLRAMSTEKPYVSPIHKLAQNLSPEERELFKQRMAIPEKPREKIDPHADPREHPDAIPYMKALQELHKSYIRSMHELEAKRQTIFAETGFSYPKDRLIPTELRPTSIKVVNKGMFEAAYEQEDYELAWWRFLRVLRFHPPTVATLFVRIPTGAATRATYRDDKAEFYDFEIDKDTLQLALYTCTAALEALQRQHNPDVHEKASIVVNGSDEPWYSRLQVHRDGSMDKALLSRAVVKLPAPETAAPKEKRVVKGRDKTRKLLNAADAPETATPEADSDSYFDAMLASKSALEAAEAPSSPKVPKLVITEAGTERVLSPEQSAAFLEELREVQARATEHRSMVAELRKEAREPFGELNWAALQLQLWQERLLFVCGEVLAHYYALLHRVNPSLYKVLTSNRPTPHLSPSGAPAYHEDQGNKLDLLKAMCDATAAAGLNVVYLECTTLMMHMSIYLEPVPTLKDRRKRLLQRLHREHQAAVEAAAEQGLPAPEFVLDEARVAAVDVKMVKTPIVYMGQHRAETKPNNVKNVKFTELSPLTALLPLTEATDIVRNLARVAADLHKYFVHHGVDERLVSLLPVVRDRTLLGGGAGMRAAFTPSNMARQTLLVLDGILVDFARQCQLALPVDYTRLLASSATITMPVKQEAVKEAVKDAAQDAAEAPAEGSTETAVVAAPVVELAPCCILGDLSTAPPMRREEYWAKVKRKELTDDVLLGMTVPQRLAALDAKHDGERATNVVARFFADDREDLLVLYMDLARRAGDKASLGKALCLWRSATKLLEWVQTRSQNDLYVDTMEMMGSVKSPEEADDAFQEIEAERSPKHNFSTLAAGDEFGKKKKSVRMKKDKRGRDIEIVNEGEIEENKQWRQGINGTAEDDDVSGLADMVEEVAEEYDSQVVDEQNASFTGNAEGRGDSKRGSKYPMAVRLAQIAYAPHTEISTQRAMACLDLLQHLAYHQINVLNVGLPLNSSSKCYSDEATALWSVARHQLSDIRDHVEQNDLAPGVDFSKLDRSEEEMLPFEIEFAKVAIMSMETLLLEQCIPSAQSLAKQVYHDGLVQRSLLENLFQGHLPEDL